jgi:hypothetical protein
MATSSNKGCKPAARKAVAKALPAGTAGNGMQRFTLEAG